MRYNIEKKIKWFLWLVLFYMILSINGILFAQPTAPEFFSVSKSGTTYKFIWGEVSGASGYILNYVQESDNVIHHLDMGNTLNFSVEITSVFKLYMAITAIDENGISDYSNIIYFDTNNVDNIPEVSKIIGINGGEVSVTDRNNLLFGTSVIFQVNSFVANSLIEIRDTALPAIIPNGIKRLGEPIDFNSSIKDFQKPVKLVLSYKDFNNDGIIDDTVISELDVGIWYFNDISKQWEERKIIKRDIDANTVTIETNHFSTYITLAREENLTPDNPNNNLIKGEYFVGVQSLGRQGCIDKKIALNCGEPYYLTVRNGFNAFPSGYTAVIDRHVTQWVGISATFSADMKSVSFDATEIFEKVKQSGNADFWEWKCDFVAEYTKLIDYVAINENDPDPPATAGGEKIFSKINVDPTNLNKVIIDWGVDISDQLDIGGTIAIKFEATYK